MKTESSKSRDGKTKRVRGRRLADPLEPRLIEVRDQAAYDRIREDCGKAMQRIHVAVIRGYYELGRLVLEAQQLPTSQRNASPIVDRLAEDIGCSSRVLRLCAKFAERVDEQLLPQMEDAGMYWEHVRVLINQGQLGELAKWMEQIKRRRLTGPDLETELRQGCLPARQGSGRKPARPKSAFAGLTQLHKTVTTTSNRFQVLFSESFHLAGELTNTPDDELNEEIRDSVAQAAERLREMAVAAKNHSVELDEVIGVFDEVFEARLADAEEAFQPDRTGVPLDL